MSRPVPRPLAFQSGFTLIELMVSMSILVVLIVILMTMVDGATKLWRHSENRVDSYREARAAMNTLASDAKSILVTTNTNLFSFDRSDKLPSTAVSAPKANNIFFLSAQPKASQDSSSSDGKPANTSDACIVGYFLAYDKVSTGSQERSRNLYRYFLSSGEAFDAMRNQVLLSEPLSTTPTASAPVGAEVLARNVTDFRINAFSIDYTDAPTGVIRKFVQSETTPMPDFLDVELTVLNNESVKRFKSETDWDDKTSATYKNNSRKFKTRLHFKTDALKDVLATPTPTPSPTPF